VPPLAQPPKLIVETLHRHLLALRFITLLIEVGARVSAGNLATGRAA
jgi:hypothetical protein